MTATRPPTGRPTTTSAPRRPSPTLVGALAAAVLLVGGIALTTRDGVTVEAVTVEAPTSVDDPTPVRLDAALYLPRGATADDPRPAVVLAHGFGSDRTALDARARRVAADGRVALTWSARGFGESQGRIDLVDVDGGARDVAALVDLLADRPEVRLDGPGDPVVALVGASYGGGHALLGATVEPRLDAVVAVAAWHDLATALAPDGVLDEQWAGVLFAGAAAASAEGLAGLLRPDADAEVAPDAGAPDVADLDAAIDAACGGFAPDLCALYVAAATSGRLDGAGVARLADSSPAGRLDGVEVPVLLVQGQQDTLFPLEQSRAAAAELAAGGATVALRWVPGGHGEVGASDPGGRVEALTDEWLDVHVPLGASGAVPAPFAWTDEVAGELLPTDALPAAGAPPGTDPATVALDGGALALAPTADGRLRAGGPAGDAERVVVRPPGALPPSVSTFPGLGGLGGLLPQVDLPGQSLSWTSDPLPQDLSIVGPVTLDLTASSVGGGDVLLVAKLQQIGAAGTTELLSSHVRPLAGPSPLAGEVVLGSYAARLEAGSRLRLVLATTDLALPIPREPAVFTVTPGAGGLVVPVAAQADVAVTPPLLRLAVPVAVVMLLTLLGAGLTRRRERTLAREQAPADAPPVRIRGLRKTYADGKVAVDGLDLDVGRGQVVGLLGPNGAGKTTTLRMLLGLVHPTGGTVELLGHPVRPGHPVLARVGVLVEGPGFVPTATGRQNLLSWWAAGGRPLAEADLERALEVADLGPAIDRPVRAYSHGMRQRLAIAQALMGDPELLVLDEPTDGLDPEQIRAMRELLAGLGERGVTVLVSSHLLAEVEQMCTHVVVVREGRAVAAGSVADLLGATRSVVVRTDDRARARQVLVGLVGEAHVQPEADGLAVHVADSGVAVADLVDALVGAGLRVDAVAPRGRLEDAFLALTSGDPS